MNKSSNETTGLRFYSFGLVVEDKTDDGDMIVVTPIEELPLLLGKLKDIKFDYNVTGTDHRGANVSSNVNGVAYVAAKWASMEGGNRSTAPNVYEGETVLLLKYASTEDVYWTDFMREPKLRRLENVVTAYSNLKEKGAAFDQETSHWIQISSRDQLIKLHTSNNRDEKAGYDFTLDLANGTFQVLDTNKNEIFLDSVNGDLKINTNNSIEFNTKRIRINGSEYVRTTAPEITENGDHITNRASQTHDIKSDGSATSEASGSNTIKGATISEQSQGSFTIEGGSPVDITPGISTPAIEVG